MLNRVFQGKWSIFYCSSDFLFLTFLRNSKIQSWNNMNLEHRKIQEKSCAALICSADRLTYMLPKRERESNGNVEPCIFASKKFKINWASPFIVSAFELVRNFSWIHFRGKETPANRHAIPCHRTIMIQEQQFKRILEKLNLLAQLSSGSLLVIHSLLNMSRYWYSTYRIISNFTFNYFFLFLTNLTKKRYFNKINVW